MDAAYFESGISPMEMDLPSSAFENPLPKPDALRTVTALSRLLTLACHEGWIAQLESLGIPIDIVDDLPGRYVSHWDERMRPFPKRASRVSLEHALAVPQPYLCAIAHSLTDLVAMEPIRAPKLLILHTSPLHRARQEGKQSVPPGFLDAARLYTERMAITVVAISKFKAESWNLPCRVVQSGVDTSTFPAWTGEIASGIRVANQIHNKRKTLLWDFHTAAFSGLPMRIVGFNPELPGVEPARNYADLLQMLSSHRFFVHTADPELEDGFNLGSIEAMAAGLPILGNYHPTSPVEHGVSGFLSNDPDELRGYAQLLLQDRALAQRMGEAARITVRNRFPLEAFKNGLEQAIRDSIATFELSQLSSQALS